MWRHQRAEYRPFNKGTQTLLSDERTSFIGEPKWSRESTLQQPVKITSSPSSKNFRGVPFNDNGFCPFHVSSSRHPRESGSCSKYKTRSQLLQEEQKSLKIDAAGPDDSYIVTHIPASNMINTTAETLGIFKDNICFTRTRKSSSTTILMQRKNRLECQI
ncbi:hypothetical protein QQP08_019518 [Theobroma cacao]|nr:hypothetical protein QQP08_019518 [Theobroma cacao]